MLSIQQSIDGRFNVTNHPPPPPFHQESWSSAILLTNSDIEIIEGNVCEVTLAK